MKVFSSRSTGAGIVLGIVVLAGCRAQTDGPRQTGWEPGSQEGSSGPWEGRFGNSKAHKVALFGGDPETEAAVLAGLTWIARHQAPEGCWNAEFFSRRCEGTKCGGAGSAELTTGVTGLVLLAFLGAGLTHLSGDEVPDPRAPGRALGLGGTVKLGLEWLISRQGPDGRIGTDKDPKFMYGHAVATQALAEAWAMTGSAILKAPAQKAVDWLVAARTPGQAWRYSPRAGTNDSSITGWCVLALWVARRAGLAVPTSCFEGANTWLDSVTTEDHDVGYDSKTATGKVVIPDDSFLGYWADHDTLAAVAFLVKRLAGQTLPEARRKGFVARLVRDPPAWEGPRIDFVYWYWGSLALLQQDGPEGPQWRGWNEALKTAIVPHQRTAKEGCGRGSWSSDVERWSRGFGGEVYATAINVLTLEIYYRYPSIGTPPPK